MKFSVVLTTLVAVASAAPSRDISSSGSKLQKRAAVFATAKTFDELSISGKNAGTAKEDALQKLSGLPTDLSTVDKADLAFLNNVNKIANQAERGAYNVEIAKTAPGEDALALQRAKIQNKVLKLTATVMGLQAQQAQGKNVTAKLDEETKKLNKNIADDVANAGKPATALKFNASTDNPAASEVPKDDATATKAGDVVDQSIKAAGGNAGAAGAKGTGKKGTKTASKAVVEAAEVAEEEDEE
ncbi:uncharacterized protein CLUP02_07891 [Colletotrichum lupini]|uniref:Small secreted protein n=1 Tax=Colletotrichum lupini TaxID=145971 RepID=A0A9Q8WG40_9PEZI|nr:uncharacterized protein CLUP02_07891 [Colletotrichum lupini]UQC82403.1 hypothetical protein CLUP02_07891 [Colletotrichum lupini]